MIRERDGTEVTIVLNSVVIETGPGTESYQEGQRNGHQRGNRSIVNYYSCL